MKKFFGFLIVAASAALMVSCTFDANYTPEPVPVPDPYLCEIIDMQEFETPSEFKEYIAGTVSEYMDEDAGKIITGILYDVDILKLLVGIYEEQGKGGISANITKYDFLYRSTDENGSPVILSGSAILPTATDPSVKKHELDAVTLFSCITEGGITVDGTPVQARAVFNQMVVTPDFQGYGSSEWYSRRVPYAYGVLAQQAVDCELAALELLEKTGARMKKGYVTYNMGVSDESAVAMAVQKLVEGSSNAALKKSINLGSTYCCAGNYDLTGLMSSMLAGGVDKLWRVPKLVGSVFLTNPDLFEGYRIEDLFSERFNSVRYAEGGSAYSLLDIIFRHSISDSRLDEIFYSYDFKDAEDILNPDLLYDGYFDPFNPLAVALVDALARGDVYNGWKPGKALMLEHGTADAVADYETSYNCYETLNAASTAAGTVHEHTYLLLGHDTMCALGISRMSIMKDPGSCILSKFSLDLQ